MRLTTHSLRSVARRMLRPVTAYIDARVDTRVRSIEIADEPPASGAELVALVDSLSLRVERASAEIQQLRSVDVVKDPVADTTRGPSQVAAVDLTAAQFTIDLLLGPIGRLNARITHPNSFDDVVDQVARVTGEQDARIHTVAAFRDLVRSEAAGVGRIAGTTENIVGKLATAGILANDVAHVLEIGTLYGLFSAALLNHLARGGHLPTLTVVDPFAGTQLQAGRSLAVDPSRSPVAASVARHNFATLGVAEERIRLIRGMSGDDEVRNTASDRMYDVVIVDGDHSREGVAADLAWVESIVAPGGIVVVDDYGDRNWGGVSQALDEYLERATSMRLVGTVATSAFLRSESSGASTT